MIDIKLTRITEVEGPEKKEQLKIFINSKKAQRKKESTRYDNENCKKNLFEIVTFKHIHKAERTFFSYVEIIFT